MDNVTINEMPIGATVQLSPACDLWMRGERFVTIKSKGRKYVHATGVRTGKTFKFGLSTPLQDARTY